MVKEQIEEFVSQVRQAPSSFYSGRWGSAGKFSDLPLTSRADFIRVPLSERRYKNERAFVKIVRGPGGPFLSEWGFNDIAQEPWGVQSKRPMVCMSDPHEALEKSMWCYENGMVPLIGEQDAGIASYAASKYQIDQLITDHRALGRLKFYLDGRGEPLDALTFVGDAFDIKQLAPYATYARVVRCVLALPETGALAEATLAEPVFRPRPDCIFEERDGEMLVTKVAPLVTPIVKYQTGIAAGTVSL